MRRYCTVKRSQWAVVTALLVSVGTIEAWCQLNERQLQKFQAQQMQRMLQDSLGPAAEVVPDMGNDRPMENALWGYGAELADAIASVQKQLQTYDQSRDRISVDILKESLPRNIKEYQQGHVESTASEPATDSLLSARNLASSVTATYQNASKQTLLVTLTDLGPYMDMMAEHQQEEEVGGLESAETEEAILRIKKIQGIKAHIQYDRINRSGTLTMKANRILVNIQGQQIPFAMLETSADKIDIINLAQLGGSQ